MQSVVTGYILVLQEKGDKQSSIHCSKAPALDLFDMTPLCSSEVFLPNFKVVCTSSTHKNQKKCEHVRSWKNSSHPSVYSVILLLFIMRSFIAPLLFYTRESCLCASYTHMSSCITFLILMHPYNELPLFLYIVLNSPDVPDLITGSLNLVRTFPKKLYIIAFHGFSCPAHFETTFCVPYL